MKNLVYVSVFYNQKYIELLHMMLRSLHNFGNIDNSIDVVILTHHTFEDEIVSICKEIGIPSTVILMNNTTIPESKWARFKIFDVGLEISDYLQVLYLDVDIIIQQDIREVFKYDLENKLYARREGDTSAEFFGGHLFREHGVVSKVSGFCSGVLLFKPCSEIRQLFSITIEHIRDYQRSGKRFGACVDQPFLNFNAITRNLHEIELLEDVVTNRPDINTTKQTICHFSGNTCSFENKHARMQKFYNNICIRKRGTSLTYF